MEIDDFGCNNVRHVVTIQLHYMEKPGERRYGSKALHCPEVRLVHGAVLMRLLGMSRMSAACGRRTSPLSR